MSSIRSIHNSLTGLVETQNEAIAALNRAETQASNARSTATRAVQTHAQALVISGDDDRYAALTRASKNSGNQQDFSALVESWKQQDIQNREERANLEKTWGTQAQVNEKARGIKQEMDTIKSAINDLAPEISAFDATTTKIEAHNRKYPKAQITPESNAGYKKFSWKNFFLWLTFINRGHQKAYKIVHEYEQKYGDYFEDKRSIEKVKANEAKLEGDEATREKSWRELLGISSRMSTLDSSFKGPEGMASSIRSMVADLALKSLSFCQHLVTEVKGADAEATVVNTIKASRLGAIVSTVSTQLSEANSTLSKLQDAEQYLNNAVGRVGNETVYFDDDGAERVVTRAARNAKATANDAIEAVRAIGEYTPAAGADGAAIESALHTSAALSVKDASTDLDFSHLKTSVGNAVDAYEAEQERIRQEQIRIAQAAALLAAQQEAAREAEAQRLRDLQNINTGFNQQSRRNDDIDTGSRGVQTSPFRQNSDDISAGTFGTQRDDSNDDISNGSSGVQDSNDNDRDNISNGNDGIAP